MSEQGATPTGAASAPSTEEKSAEGYVDELVVIRRVRKELDSADPSARSRILSYVVQREQDDSTKVHRAALDRLHQAAANGALKGATPGYEGQQPA